MRTSYPRALATFWATAALCSGSDAVRKGGTAPTVEGNCDLKIVVWNVERGEQLSAVSSAMKKLAPAVALLQEVDLNVGRSGRKNVAEELAKGLGVNYVFAAEFEEMGQGRKGSPAYHGQAILTALQIASSRVVRFRNQSDYWRPRWYVPNWAIFQRRDGGRLALVAELEAASRKLVVYDVHLESRGPESLRLREIEEIVADASQYPADTAILMAGDLNTRVPGSPVVDAMTKAGFRKAVGGEVSTLRGAALDWILVRGPVTFRDGRVHKDIRGSDHFPLTVQIRLEPPACP